MHNFTNNYVRVSELASYYLCPRLVYFQRRREQALSDAEVRAGVFKSISHALPSIVSSPQPGAALEAAIGLACSDSLLIYGPAHEPAILNASRDARARAGDILAGLAQEKKAAVGPKLAGILSPATVALTIYSGKLRLSGTIDKVVYDGTAMVPVVVSASMPPETGIYSSDRVRLAAYSLLLSEKYGDDCPLGAVEYVPGWCVRRAKVRHEDKRKALYARNRVLEMGEGGMPDAARSKWCDRCGYYGPCNVKVSTLAGLFKKKEVG